MKITYFLDKKIAAKAFLSYHKTDKRVKIIIETVLLGALIGMFLHSFIVSKDRMQLFLLFASLVVLFMVYYAPFLSAKSLGEKFKSGLEFNLELTQNSIKIKPQTAEEKELSFEEISKAVENRQFFFIVTNDRFYPIPKEQMKQDEILLFSESLKKGLEVKFKYNK